MPAKSDFGAQPALGALGQRGKLGPRTGIRSARGGINSENINPNPGACIKGSTNQRSPRLGTCTAGANNGRQVFTFAASRQHGSVLGDITNIASSKESQKLKPVSQFSQPQHTELPLAPSPSTIDVQSATAKECTISLSAALAPAAPKIEVTNVQEVEEYADEIVNDLFKQELSFMPRLDYMETQADLTPKMRTILIDWLIEVHMKYRLRPETLHLSVNLIDRYLSRMPVLRKRLQLIGVVAMFIAAKFEEINPPELHDWVYITDRAYTKQDVLVMECTMLTTLSFQIMVPTIAHFFTPLQKANGCNSTQQQLAQYIIELGLLDTRMQQYVASHTASAALMLTNELLGRSPIWSASMVQHSRQTETALRGCAEVLRQLLEADRAGAGGQLQAVHKKYSTKERHSVATMTL